MIYILCNVNCRCFIPFLQNFEYILEKNKYEVKLIYSVDNTDLVNSRSNNDLFFVIWNDFSKLPEGRCIVYNMDPMVSHIEESFKKFLSNSSKSTILKVVDYTFSDLNRNAIQKILNELQLKCEIDVMPYGYSSYHSFFKENICGIEPLEKTIDILFYGNVSERRQPMINGLRELSSLKGYTFIVRNNDLYDEREKILIINSSKIIISFASNDTKKMGCNDLARSAQVISSGNFIITEYLGDYVLESHMQEYVPHYNTIEELIEKVDYYLTYPEERIKLINEANTQFKKEINLEKTLINLIVNYFPKIIIAISGKIGSGKDTVVDMIIDKYPIFQRRSFALKLKKVVSVITNTTLEQNISQTGKSYIPQGFTDSLGQLQQKIGEGIKSLISEDIWVNCLLESGLPDFTIITDCRHVIEADMIKKRGGYIIRIEGDPIGIRKINKANRDLNHRSEIDLDDYDKFDYMIDNSKLHIEELRTLVLEIIQQIIQKKVVD